MPSSWKIEFQHILSFAPIFDWPKQFKPQFPPFVEDYVDLVQLILQIDMANKAKTVLQLWGTLYFSFLHVCKSWFPELDVDI